MGWALTEWVKMNLHSNISTKLNKNPISKNWSRDDPNLWPPRRSTPKKMQLQVCLRFLFQQIFHGKSSNSWRVGSCSNTLSSSNEGEFIGLHQCVVRIFTHHLTIRIKDRNIGIHIYANILKYMDPMENSRNYTFQCQINPNHFPSRPRCCQVYGTPGWQIDPRISTGPDRCWFLYPAHCLG